MKIPVRDQKCVNERFAKINKVAQNQLMRGMVCSGSSSTIIVSVASAGGRVGIFFLQKMLHGVKESIRAITNEAFLT